MHRATLKATSTIHATPHSLHTARSNKLHSHVRKIAKAQFHNDTLLHDIFSYVWVYVVYAVALQYPKLSVYSTKP